ncbi:hypothetical protein H4R34_002236 [Dimargaris verticillata]|uniref:Uncharacterized protein n=1 Tax=Dimargaris verticillata TaxID=2761393 RepID=A0A9W8B976_9FUNG|nr:hypothetical protein H4R34_002236 [Dimargaris verticillata]
MDNPKPSGSQLPTADSQTAPASTQPEASKTRWPRQRQRRKPGNASTSATAQVPITAESSTAPTAPTNEPSPTSNTPAHRPGKPRRSKNKAPENSAKVANSANHAEPSSQSNAHSSSTPTTKDKRQPRRRHAKKLFSQLSDPAQPSASGEVARGKVPEHLIPELPADADLRTTLEHNLRHGTHESLARMGPINDSPQLRADMQQATNQAQRHQQPSVPTPVYTSLPPWTLPTVYCTGAANPVFLWKAVGPSALQYVQHRGSLVWTALWGITRVR